MVRERQPLSSHHQLSKPAISFRMQSIHHGAPEGIGDNISELEADRRI